MSDPRTPLDALGEFYVGIHRAMDRLMKANGASFARTKLLLYIKRNGAMRAIDISEAFGHAPRTTTEAIDGLERDGLVRRDPDPLDRRAKRISVTPLGLAAVDASEPVRQAFLREVFVALDEAERETLAALLDKLTAQLATLDRGDASADQ